MTTKYYAAVPQRSGTLELGEIADDFYVFENQKDAVDKAVDLADEDSENASVFEITLVGVAEVTKRSSFKEVKRDAKKA